MTLREQPFPKGKTWPLLTDDAHSTIGNQEIEQANKRNGQVIKNFGQTLKLNSTTLANQRNTRIKAETGATLDLKQLVRLFQGQLLVGSDQILLIL